MEASTPALKKRSALVSPILAVALEITAPLCVPLSIWLTNVLSDAAYAALELAYYDSPVPALINSLFVILLFCCPAFALAGIVLGIVYLFRKKKRPIGIVLSVLAIAAPFLIIGILSLLVTTGMIRLM